MLETQLFAEKWRPSDALCLGRLILFIINKEVDNLTTSAPSNTTGRKWYQLGISIISSRATDSVIMNGQSQRWEQDS